MTRWVYDARLALRGVRPGFGVLVDLRALLVLSPESRALLQEGQRLFRGAGMTRSAVILSSTILTLQFRTIAKETGIFPWERYINVNAQPDWYAAALAWVEQGVEPERPLLQRA